ncbi:putative lipoprotein YdeJ [Bacillus subtilis]|nr:putative lipoprotein YdeJ [Bacillus subtilis]
MGGKEEKSNNDSALQSEKKNNETEDSNQITKDESEATTGSEESGTKNSNENASTESSTDESKETSLEGQKNEANSEKDNVLAEYSSEKIEYARVWLQLGANQEIDELNVRHISAGEPINPNDDTSAGYPEDVIQLAGSRLVDGSVTYSGNGDGTIKVYDVPLRWDSSDDLSKGVMREVTEDIIKNAKTVYVDTGDSEKIKRLIDIMAIH